MATRPPRPHRPKSLAGLASTINFNIGSNQLTVSDTAANLLDPDYTDGLALATAWELSAPAVVLAADAETLLTSPQFIVNQSLTISNSSFSLLDGYLGRISRPRPVPQLANIHVQLAAPETLDANTAADLLALHGFTADGLLSIQDSSAYLLNSANLAAETVATLVTLAGNETVSAATAASLAGLPNFMLGTNDLTLASNDFASAAVLNALGSLGANFSSGGFSLTLTQNASVDGLTVDTIGAFGSKFYLNGHTVTLTQDALALTPSEYTAVQADGLSLNSHVLSAMPGGVTIGESGGNISITGTV